MNLAVALELEGNAVKSVSLAVSALAAYPLREGAAEVVRALPWKKSAP